MNDEDYAKCVKNDDGLYMFTLELKDGTRREILDTSSPLSNIRSMTFLDSRAWFVFQEERDGGLAPLAIRADEIRAILWDAEKADSDFCGCIDPRCDCGYEEHELIDPSKE